MTVGTTTTRRGRRVLALAVTVVLGAGATAALTRPDPPATPPAATPTVAPLPDRAALLPSPTTDAPAPTEAGLQAAVDVALADPAVAGQLAVSVVDALTGEPVYERDATTPLIPASTAKIATAVAALTALDPAARLTTRVVAGAVPGEVVLVGGGDPTLAGPEVPPGYPEPARLTELAAGVRTALGPAVVTRVVVDASLFTGERLGPGWRPGYVSGGAVAPVGALMVDGGRVRPDRVARHPDPALAAGRALAALLQPGAPVAVEPGTASAGAVELASVTSPPVRRLVEGMLVRSDNDLAEALARHVALARGRAASFEGAAAAVQEVLAPALAAVGVPADAVALVDGSGLSRANRLQPAALTRLLAGAGADDRFAPLLTGLPVAGFDGTLERRYRTGGGVPAAGAVRAKTGTLDGVSALAGLVLTADGRLLAFDVTADGVPTGATRGAEAALDRFAAALAGCGCR